MYMMSVEVDANCWIEAVWPRKTLRAHESKRIGWVQVAWVGSGARFSNSVSPTVSERAATTSHHFTRGQSSLHSTVLGSVASAGLDSARLAATTTPQAKDF